MRKWILRILLLVFLSTGMISLWSLVQIHSQYEASSSAIENLKIACGKETAGEEENAKDASADGTGSEDSSLENQNEIKGENADSSDAKQKDNQFLVRLHEMNPDCVAWITVDGTRIDYPVMYRPDDEEYYLKRNFQKQYDLCGLPYISENCNLEIGDNWIVYGHHMRNGSMFADLDCYKKERFYKKHPDVELTTLEGVEQYRIVTAFAVSVYTENDFRYYDFNSAESESAFDSFMNQCRKYQYYDTSETAEYGDHLLILSTCEYTHENGRMVVVAKQYE